MVVDFTTLMDPNGTVNIATGLGISLGTLLIVAVIVIILKGLAMYKAARLKDKVWFWVLLIFNTVGILPAIYLIIKRNKKVN